MAALAIRKTGRKWGDKREAQVSKIKIANVICTVEESDIWEGPCRAEETGNYFRLTTISWLLIDERR